MDEKTMVNDVLGSVKADLGAYQTAISESENIQLRQVFQQIRNNDESFQYELFKKLISFCFVFNASCADFVNICFICVSCTCNEYAFNFWYAVSCAPIKCLKCCNSACVKSAIYITPFHKIYKYHFQFFQNYTKKIIQTLNFIIMQKVALRQL